MQQPEMGFTLKHLHFFDDTTGVAMGGVNYDFGIAQFTLDGGKTWSLDTVSQKIVRDFDVIEDNIYGIGIDNFLTRKESSLPWEELPTPERGESNGLIKTETGYVLVGGIAILEGFVIRLSNDFSEVSRLEIDGEMNAVARSSDTNLHMVGFGSIRRSEDEGMTWVENISDGDDYRDVFFINERTGWIVGNAGSILKTEDGGDSWKACREATAHNKLRWNRIHFADESLGAIAGDGGLVWMTKDGGQNWIELDEIPEVNYSSVFVNEDFISLGSDQGQIIKLFL
jgi:photosystem II stability/assembly factor-like uncharacterized protein